MVFVRLKDFNLKIKPKKCHFFQCSVVFLGYVLSVDGISTNPEKEEKVQNWPVPSNQKSSILFWGWPLIIGTLSQSLLQFQNVCMN